MHAWISFTCFFKSSHSCDFIKSIALQNISDVTIIIRPIYQSVVNWYSCWARFVKEEKYKISELRRQGRFCFSDRGSRLMKQGKNISLQAEELLQQKYPSKCKLLWWECGCQHMWEAAMLCFWDSKLESWVFTFANLKHKLFSLGIFTLKLTVYFTIALKIWTQYFKPTIVHTTCLIANCFIFLASYKVVGEVWLRLCCWVVLTDKCYTTCGCVRTCFPFGDSATL